VSVARKAEGTHLAKNWQLVVGDRQLLRINTFHQDSTTSTGNQELSQKLTLGQFGAVSTGASPRGEWQDPSGS
jgi:hypothetical protein